MTHLVFFEKPGCAGNARQRAVLESAGHTLDRRNLLTTQWTTEGLLIFLGHLPVPDWFNRVAPKIKSGDVQPDVLDAQAALALLLKEPLLIRRPLMQRSDNASCHVGFEAAAVDAWIGLGINHASNNSLEGCASSTESCATPV